ncbi:HlyD family secretion protein [Rhizobium azooxidifex]|uniref:HlyD family secretion protein n=1 Tax=Mycoplana azooxidifex TaxID=1636188 RepID=A0A7W6GHR4_9HYPH|nr:HlyD family efflux transporter periplasmic adaptor subunit [Mycoplana azooxidifex]MBB3975710.1 HlyD family secretion protein [Mycoplana azooxidifex]
MTRKGWIVAAVLAVLVVGSYYAWTTLRGSGLPAGIASGNGRIEAVEIDISSKIAGRIAEIFVNEGDFVEAGQELARMDTAQLVARRRQAEAELARAKVGVETADSLVRQQQAQLEAASALIEQREAELNAAETRRDRSEQLRKSNTVSQQVLDDDRANYQAAVATVAAARAQQAAAEAAVSSAKAQVIDAKAAVEAADAAIESIDADLDDSVLRSPRRGRVQYRVAQPGEVLSAGGRVLNLVDLTDVSMTFFLPTEDAGRVALGSEVRLVLDAIPQYVVPAKATFVADVAQFTPKTVETQEERLKLMFRVKARIEPELLERYIKQVKTGLPGMAYVKVAPDAEWPDWLGNVVK